MKRKSKQYEADVRNDAQALLSQKELAQYSMREVDQFFKASDERSEAFHSKLMERMDDFEANTGESLLRIEEQTKKTNGSVASLKMWRAYITGGVAVLTVLVIPLILTLLQAGKI